MKSEGGRQLIYDLVKECDVLVENYLPGKLKELGLGYEKIKELNPKMIYASITGYGHTGPYANRPGYDVIIEVCQSISYTHGQRVFIFFFFLTG